MKAGVLKKLGTAPVYQDFADPTPENDNQLVLKVTAAALKNIDKLRAGGEHYASYKELPTVVGLDGVGTLEDGTRVYANGITGMMAEKALIAKDRFTVLPDEIDDLVAAALPNAILGAAMPLLFRGNLQAGQTVLINGATGVTGRLAVQIAQQYGAATIIVTGRDAAALDELKHLGADDAVSLKQADEAIIQQLKAIHQKTPIDLVIDYLWGQPIELIIRSLGGEGVDSLNHTVKIVAVGDMAGKHISLSSGTLRSSAIELLGSGFGSLSKDDLQKMNTEVLPKMFQLAADGKLSIETQAASLADIEQVWNQEVASGKRLVVRM